MKQDILLEYTQKAGFQTGDLLAYYNLSGIVDTDNETDRNSQYKITSGHTAGTYDTCIIFNELQTTGSQLFNTGDGHPSGANPIIAIDNYPAQILSSSTAITGSGNFDGKSLLGVTHPLTGDNWTCFLDFSGEFSTANPTLSQVLVSTMTGHNSLSGFHVGINGSNRLYYEYIAGSEGSNIDRTVETLPKHLKTFNLLSIAKTPNTLELSLHRPDQETFSLNTPLSDYTDSSTLLFGGFQSHDGVRHFYDPNLFYTGFSGYINSILLYDDYMTETSRDTIAESFYLDSYTASNFSTGTRTAKQVTGVEIQSQAIGFGVTGYKKVISGYLTNEAGQQVPNYVNFGQTGPIYKNVLVDLTGQNNIVSTTGIFTSESTTRNDNYVTKANSMEGSVSFSIPVAASENLEIYTHSDYLNTINYSTEQTYSFGSFDLNPNGSDKNEFRVEGYQIKNDNFSYNPDNKQPFLQLYRNGFMQYEVSGLYSVADVFNNVGGNLKEVGDLNGTYKGNYFINDNNAGAEASQINSLNKYPLTDRIENNRYEIALNSQSDILDNEDFLYFDVVSGASLTGVYEGSSKHFTGDFLGKDIYFDGLKLTSGTDYYQNSTGGKTSYLLSGSVLGSSQAALLFVPQASDTFTQTKYSQAGTDFSIPSVFSEQVWRNGVRQFPGIDYVKNPKDSLIGTSTPSSEKNSFVFDPKSTYLDVKIKEEEAPMPGYRSKVFSFDSKQQTNLFSGSS